MAIRRGPRPCGLAACHNPRVEPRIVRVLAPNPGPFTLEGTNTWVVGERPAVVIDPGPDDSGHILAVLDEAEPVAAILLTHRHPDHAPGAARLAEAAGAPVHAFRPEAGEPPLADGDVVDANGVHLRVIHTPGHTPDHVCYLLEGEGKVFTGDTVLGRGTSVIDPPDGDMAAYVRSLERLRSLDPQTIYPGHGPVIFTPRGLLDFYLRHRRDRERQVLDGLEKGPQTPEELVPSIYAEEVSPDLFPAAARSVLAHLLKLEREGRIARTGRHRDQRFDLVEEKACQRCGRPAAPRSRFCRRCAFAVLQEGPLAAEPNPADRRPD
jgi:glyoxylase-like metal-dependent hydrolase (beta-lactamase superfamily II)